MWRESILDKVNILLLPRYNPDGIAEFNRANALGIDLNRDHIRLNAPQSRAIRKLFCKFVPHIAVDTHEFSAPALYRGHVHGSDLMFAAAKNLNIHPDIRKLSEELFIESVKKELETSKFRCESYVPTNGTSISFKEAGSDAKIGRNAMGLTQCLSFLCEARGIGIADQHFHRRTAASVKFLESLLKVATDNFDHVYATMERSINAFLQSKQDIVIIDKPATLDRTFTLIEVCSGKLCQVPVRFTSMTPTIPILTRSRPEAYVLPATMSAVARRLVDSGLNVEIVEEGWTASVEILKIKKAVLGQTYFEGVIPVRVKLLVVSQTERVSSGAYLVSTRQQNAALAFIALEPENIDSYVSTNIIPAFSGEEYPVYRVMTRI